MGIEWRGGIVLWRRSALLLGFKLHLLLQNRKCSDDKIGSGSFCLRDDSGCLLGTNPQQPETESVSSWQHCHGVFLHHDSEVSKSLPSTAVCHAPWLWAEILISKKSLYLSRQSWLTYTCVNNSDGSQTGETSPMSEIMGLKFIVDKSAAPFPILDPEKHVLFDVISESSLFNPSLFLSPACLVAVHSRVFIL